jgi:hypothetical protein
MHALRAACVFLGCALLGIAVPFSMGNTGCATERTLKGPGEPCTRTAECEADLMCAFGVCSAGPDVDAAVPDDAGAGDVGGHDASGAASADAAPDATF